MSIFGANNNTNSTAGLAGLEQQYQELLRLRQQQNAAATTVPYNSYRTVFNDITDEWNSCSDDERRFVEADSDYMQANMNYAQQFNAFLIDNFGLQFANSKYGASAEKVLVALRNARGKFKSAAAEDVARIKQQNADLQRQLKELEELINNEK